MNNQSRYRAMMGEVHASADLIGKVKDIPMEKKMKKGGIALRVATATCAGLLGVFVVTNGVCYAATGETWVEKATVYINGEPVDVDVHLAQDGNVTTATIDYTVEDVDGAGGDVQMIVEGDADDVRDATFEITDYTVEGAPDGSPNADGMVLESADGRVLLAPGEGVEPIDLTDDLTAHGGATGTFDYAGKTFVYQVSGEPGNWHANVEAQS